MILSEEEALQKRCTPALGILFVERERYLALQAADPSIGTNCIGSRCMLWREVTTREGSNKGYCGSGSAPIEVLCAVQREAVKELREASEKSAREAQQALMMILGDGPRGPAS